MPSGQSYTGKEILRVLFASKIKPIGLLIQLIIENLFIQRLPSSHSIHKSRSGPYAFVDPGLEDYRQHCAFGISVNGRTYRRVQPGQAGEDGGKKYA